MKIIDKNLKFTQTPSDRSCTKYIVLHPAAAEKCTVEDVHRWHRDGNGWFGIGYHFFVAKDGKIYRGRPVNSVGAHAPARNGNSIGVCFEGDYMREKTMPQAQIEAGAMLIAWLRKQYRTIEKVEAHRDVTATDCPGKYFPFEKIARGATAKMARSALRQSAHLEKEDLTFDFDGDRKVTARDARKILREAAGLGDG